MINQIVLKPRDGLKVRKPNGEHLKAEGETVTDSPYWRRRLRDGDVEKNTLPKPAKTKSAKSED